MGLGNRSAEWKHSLFCFALFHHLICILGGERVVGWLQATVYKSALTWDGYQFDLLWIPCALKVSTVNIWLICRGTTKGWREATTTEEDEEKRAVWNIWQEFWGRARHGAFGERHYPFVQCARDSGQVAWSPHPRFNFPRFHFELTPFLIFCGSKWSLARGCWNSLPIKLWVCKFTVSHFTFALKYNCVSSWVFSAHLCAAWFCLSKLMALLWSFSFYRYELCVSVQHLCSLNNLVVLWSPSFYRYELCVSLLDWSNHTGNIVPFYRS